MKRGPGEVPARRAGSLVSGPDRQGNAELAVAVADAQDQGHGVAGLAGERDPQVDLNYSLDHAGRSACVDDLGRVAADLGQHEEDGPRKVAGIHRAVDHGRRKLAGAGGPQRDHRTWRRWKGRRIDSAVLIQYDGLTRAGAVGGEDAADSGHHRNGKKRGRKPLVLHLCLDPAGGHAEWHDGVDLAGARESHGAGHAVK